MAKEVHWLIGYLGALGRLLAKSLDQCLPLDNTLSGAKRFTWIEEKHKREEGSKTRREVRMHGEIARGRMKRKKWGYKDLKKGSSRRRESRLPKEISNTTTSRVTKPH